MSPPTRCGAMDPDDFDACGSCLDCNPRKAAMAEFAKSDILDALADADIEEEPRWNYSGRGMYGRECFGIVGTMEDYSNFLLGLTTVFYDQVGDIYEARGLVHRFTECVSTDSMGYDTIFYFPGIVVLENE